MKRRVLIILAVCLCYMLYADNIKTLQQEQERIQKQLRETDDMLKQTQKSEKATVTKLNLLNNNIRERKKLIRNISKELSSLDSQMEELSVKNKQLSRQLSQLQDEYARLVRETHFAAVGLSPVKFILSADNFRQMARRMRYMRTFMKYRQHQAEEIARTQADIEIQNELLNNTRRERADALQKQKREQDNLSRDERKQQQMLKELKTKEKKLIARQKQQQKKADELNRKIDELVRKQTSSASSLTKEQQLIAGGFESNKGRLPWPVEKGFVSGNFGTYQHPVYEHVTVNNKGIYIQTTSGSDARAVFEGEITSCIMLGSNYAVIIQHGNYRTVYSNLKSLYVKQGDKVKAKQKIGKISTQTDEDNKTELYFQVYKDRTLLNPSQWLAN